MQLIKFKITPQSSFGSFPKGDMIFGHFTYHLFMQNRDNPLKDYLATSPKIIFSDFLPDGYLYKPTLPLSYFGVDEKEKKEFRKKTWIKIDDLQNGNIKECESLSFYKSELVVKNSINRFTFSTDDSGKFAPYTIEEITFLKQPVLFCMYNEESFSIDEITATLRNIGKNGFGKKSTIGKGQFDIEIDSSFKGFENIDTNSYLTISPTILNNQNIKNGYYNTFNRFGKYVDSKSPFKKYILMADSGAVVCCDDKKEYIGRAIDNGIKRPSFVQGYSILVPFKFDCEEK